MMCLSRLCLRALPALLLWAVAGCSPETDPLPYYRAADLTPEWLSPASAELQSVHRVPDFTFVDQDGTVVSNGDLDGTVYVANFFFTSCSQICPTMRSNLARVQDAFLHDDGVRLISHSVAPEVDSVSVLSAYARANGIRSGKWHLVTGPFGEIQSLARLGYFVDLDDQTGFDREVIHTETLVLVDERGHIRGVYTGTLAYDVERLIEDISILRS
jgi:protein SCO1/2